MSMHIPARACMMIGIILNITADENGAEHFEEPEKNEPRRTVDDLIRLALKTITAE